MAKTGAPSQRVRSIGHSVSTPTPYFLSPQRGCSPPADFSPLSPPAGGETFFVLLRDNPLALAAWPPARAKRFAFRYSVKHRAQTVANREKTMNRAFTLIELLIVVAIIGILAAIAAPTS